MFHKISIRDSSIALILTGFFTLAQAAEVYAGIELGSSATSATDYKDNQALIGSGRFFGGLLFDEAFSIEAAYTIMGDFHHKTGIGPLPYYVAADSYEIAAVAKFELFDNINFLVLAGVYDWTDEYFLDEASVQTDSGTDVTYGAGIEYLAGDRWSLGLKAQIYQRDGGELDLYSLRYSYFFE